MKRQVFKNELIAFTPATTIGQWEQYTNNFGVTFVLSPLDEDIKEYVKGRIRKVSNYNDLIRRVFPSKINFNRFLNVCLSTRNYQTTFFTMKNIAILDGINDGTITQKMVENDYWKVIPIGYRVRDKTDQKDDETDQKYDEGDESE